MNTGLPRCAITLRRSSPMAETPPSSAGIPSAGRSVPKMTVEPSSAGSKPTTKIQFSRPMTYSTLSTLWSHYLVDRPENQLTGVGFFARRLSLESRTVHGRSRGIYRPSSGSIGYLKAQTFRGMTPSAAKTPSLVTNVTDASGPL